MSWFRGGEALGITGAHDISFHDRRGLIIVPVAVASLLADLMLFRPALVAAGAGGSASQPGGVSTIANLPGPEVRIHVVSPHGAAYRSRRTIAELEVIDQAGVFVRTVPASGVVDLAPTNASAAPPLMPRPMPPLARRCSGGWHRAGPCSQLRSRHHRSPPAPTRRARRVSSSASSPSIWAGTSSVTVASHLAMPPSPARPGGPPRHRSRRCARAPRISTFSLMATTCSGRWGRSRRPCRHPGPTSGRCSARR